MKDAAVLLFVDLEATGFAPSRNDMKNTCGFETASCKVSNQTEFGF